MLKIATKVFYIRELSETSKHSSKNYSDGADIYFNLSNIEGINVSMYLPLLVVFCSGTSFKDFIIRISCISCQKSD